MDHTKAADKAPADQEAGFRASMVAMRAEKDLSQTALANMLRDAGYAFHQQTVAKIEVGERPVRLEEAYAIAAALGSDVDEMTRGPVYIEKGRALRTAHKEVMHAYEQAKEAARNLIEAMLDLEWEVAAARKSGEFSELEVVWDGSAALQYDPISAVQDAIAGFAAAAASAEVLDRYTVKEQTLGYVRELYQDALRAQLRSDHGGAEGEDGEQRETP